MPTIEFVNSAAFRKFGEKDEDRYRILSDVKLRTHSPPCEGPDSGPPKCRYQPDPRRRRRLRDHRRRPPGLFQKGRGPLPHGRGTGRHRLSRGGEDGRKTLAAARSGQDEPAAGGVVAVVADIIVPGPEGERGDLVLADRSAADRQEQHWGGGANVRPNGASNKN